jgi:peptidoglycan hydrolase CwlO-like protein
MNYWVEVLIGSATGAVGWFAGSKMRKVQEQGGEYENYQKFVDTTRTIIKDLREQVTELITQNSELRVKVNHLEDEIKQVKMQYPCKECPINGQGN